MLDKKKKLRRASALKTITIPMGETKRWDKKLFLLMPARQVEEVLHTVLLQPVPFGPDWFLGLCLWREHILPVFDLNQYYGLAEDSGEALLYLVVRVLVPETTGPDKQLLRCVLRVAHQISTGDLPQQAGPVAHHSDLDVLGIFEQEDRLLLVPHLAPLVSAAAPLAL
jgi:chemotaxis signal transduction protein